LDPIIVAQQDAQKFPVNRNFDSPAEPRRVEETTLGAIPVSVALHKQKTDRGERRKNARCKTGVLQLAESANIQHARLSRWRLLRGTAYPNKQRPADLKCTRQNALDSKCLE
jgi:hypothetical protein